MEDHLDDKDKCKSVLYGFGRILRYVGWYSENKDDMIIAVIRGEVRSMKKDYSEKPVKYVNTFLKENDSDERMPKDFKLLLTKATRKNDIADINGKKLRKLEKQFYRTLAAVDKVEFF